MEKHEFDRCIDEALQDLPEHIRAHLEEVAIVVEDRPKRRVRGLLLGLYEGVPATAWGKGFTAELPDKITLFKEHIEWAATSPEEVPHVIRETLYHEIAHHFGYEHDHIHKMEHRWRRKRGQAGEGG